ncbi:MAG: hypothetical protein JWM99_1541 [Verrucomicrobiales bacterium]|nr:hypothetical protein [Verrucomicrobiales bacterium]
MDPGKHAGDSREHHSAHEPNIEGWNQKNRCLDDSSLFVVINRLIGKWLWF